MSGFDFEQAKKQFHYLATDSAPWLPAKSQSRGQFGVPPNR
jgi:hypothetical protein